MPVVTITEPGGTVTVVADAPLGGVSAAEARAIAEEEIAEFVSTGVLDGGTIP